MKIYKPIIAFLTGSIYLSFFDYWQGRCNIESFNSSTFSIIRTFLQFGFLAVILDRLVPWFEKNFEFRWQFESNIHEVFSTFWILTILYLITLFSSTAPLSLIMCAFILFTFINIISSYKKNDWKYMCTLGLLGSGAESILTYLHTFSYSNPDILGIPLWLPLLWANGGMLVRRLFNLPWFQWKDE